MSKREKMSIEARIMEEPFDPPPKEYKYRCLECGTELLVNKAIIDVGIGMAKFNKEYHKGTCSKSDVQSVITIPWSV